MGLLIPRISNAASITDPIPGMIAYNTSTNKYINYDGTSWGVLLSSSGSFPVQIEDSDFDTKILVENAENDQDSISFHTSGSEKMVITKLGDVGIGTSTPSAKLDVIGSIQIVDGTEGSGKVLTSDANGNSSWQNPAGGGGTAQMIITASMLAQASAATGYFFKAADKSSQTPADRSKITQSGNFFGNGDIDGFLMPYNYIIKEIHLIEAACAVDAGSVDPNPTIRLDFYTHSFNSRSLLATERVALPDNIGVGIWNNLGGGTGQKYAAATGLNIIGNAGDLIGWEFVNEIGTDKIASLSRCIVTLIIEKQ